jgi:hypothetical protein
LFELEETRCQLVTCDVGEFGENQKHKLIPSQFKSGLLLEDFTFYHKGRLALLQEIAVFFDRL